jgi:hypothetical protein
VTTLEIDDGEATMTESDAGLEVESVAVRAAMGSAVAMRRSTLGSTGPPSARNSPAKPHTVYSFAISPAGAR